jgi:hypothetical protein
MASGSPKNHVVRLGYRLGDRSGNLTLAPEERIVTRGAGRSRVTLTWRWYARSCPRKRQNKHPKLQSRSVAHHKFPVGERVTLAADVNRIAVAGGYVITKLLPERGANVEIECS